MKLKNLLQPFRLDKIELDVVYAQLAWLASQDAQLRIQKGRLNMEVFGYIDGSRVRLCDARGETLLEAIQDAQEIIGR